VKKAMKAWRIPPDFWIAIEKGTNQYAAQPLKRDKEDMPPEPQTLFGTTFYTPRNILQIAFRKQSHVWVGRTFSKGEHVQNVAHTSKITSLRAISRKITKNGQQSLY
jgi:hypothetical protein